MVQCHFLHPISFNLLRCPEEDDSVFVHAYVPNVFITCNVFFVYDKMTCICMYGYTQLIKFSVYPHVREHVCRQMCMEA